MTFYKCVLLTLAAVCLTPTLPLPNGAPESVCESLKPYHGGGIPPMASPSPFRFTTSSSAVGQGQIIRIEIEATPPELSFGGFMLHARSSSPPYQVLGRFSTSGDGAVKLISCGGADNTATHVTPSPKRELGLEWQAPNDYLGEVVFNGTVAQDYAKFWVGIESTPVQIVQRGNAQPPIGISTTRRPATTTAPVYVPEREVPMVRGADPFYDDCGSTKGCFGFPDGCVSTKSCKAMSSVIVRGERYLFEMKAGEGRPAYVALALSDDNKMGDDSVMECVPNNGAVELHTSYTTAAPYTAPRHTPSYMKILNSSYIDGTIYCMVERNPITKVNGRNFDLIKGKFHLLLATGPELKENSVGYHHGDKLATGQPQSLAVVSAFGGASKLLLRLHGAFMLIAWIGTASLGMLIARYFKHTWVGKPLGGKDRWFVWHRVFMVLTWLLTMAGFIIIFVEIGGWSSEDNPHAIFGLVTTILCFLQPIGALLRPAPSSKNRPFFNWGHWLGGNLAHLLSIVTIFFAVQLVKAELPRWMDWILVAFVAFHLIMHFIFSISGCMSERQVTQRVTAFPMTDMTPSRNGMGTSGKQDAPYANVRKIMLTVYIMIVLLFVIALVVIAVLAPITDTVKSN